MISVSDNTATDMLLHTLGRENVERMMATLGVAARGAQSAVAVDAGDGGDQDRRRRRRSPPGGGRRGRAPTAARDRLCGGRCKPDRHRRLHRQSRSRSTSNGSPRRTISSGSMDWLRREGDDTARAILAINPGLGRQLRGRARLCRLQGRLGARACSTSPGWSAPAAAHGSSSPASWNNPAAPVEESRLIGLMARAIRLVR